VTALFILLGCNLQGAALKLHMLILAPEVMLKSRWSLCYSGLLAQRNMSYSFSTPDINEELKSHNASPNPQFSWGIGKPLQTLP